MDQFNLDDQWKVFLQRMALIEEEMPLNQIRMMRQAFMGGWGQSLFVLREEMPDSEEESIEKLNCLWQQVADYWVVEATTKN